MVDLKRAAKSMLKVELGCKHLNNCKYVKVKKGKVGGNCTVDIIGTVNYEECLSKA